MLTSWVISSAELVEMVLSCRVETALKNRSSVVSKKAETITIELMQLGDSFNAVGYGEMANVVGTNDSRSGASNIKDRSTANVFDVDFLQDTTDSATGKTYTDQKSFRLERVSGKLFSSRTLKSIGPSANLVTTGVCEKASRKF